MTAIERANPKMIDGSRRSRIAKGAGRTVADVNQLVDRFFEARKMMQQMARGGGMPGMPGSPGMALGKRAKARQAPQAKKNKGKRVSGNPAKRAQADAEAPAAPAANPFGLPAGGADFDADAFQLPAGLDQYLK
jgi:signal recognition particle subunit SRP54